MPNTKALTICWRSHQPEKGFAMLTGYENKQSAQATLRRLAEMHENGSIVPELAGLTTKGALENALFISRRQRYPSPLQLRKQR
jgi:hypothetical protein